MFLHRKSTGTPILPTLLTTLVAAFVASLAHAVKLEDCGGIFLRDADARCEFRTEEHCSATCSYGAVQSSCVAQIYEVCERECIEVPTEQCETQCQDTCTAECTKPVAEETPDTKQCQALCAKDCEISCTDPCGKCDEACLYTCSDKCTELCGGAADAGATECDTTCTSACTASCTAKANAQCQIDCQMQVFEECEPMLVEQCLDTCETQVGAIFCDGQYLASKDSEECATEIDSETGIQVDRSDVMDEAPAPKGSTVANSGGCAVAIGTTSQSAASFSFLGVAFLVGVAMRVRRRRNQCGLGS